ncbi:MAG: hypothetical protein A2086_07270 [Spirochaetes bacterium GWD1_27_9]|nr:MAG: hypothetical protein A2Y34_06850 [Spirochaetes bacterium GWC1_27_15]OHD32201.1 MAG: hypothetical protein A2086_07270 [Spirochaetes bacterium GWD1_27_9]
MNKKLESLAKQVGERTGIYLSEKLNISEIQSHLKRMLSISQAIRLFLFPIIFLIVLFIITNIILAFLLKSTYITVFFSIISIFIVITIGVILGLKMFVNSFIKDAKQINLYLFELIQTVNTQIIINKTIILGDTIQLVSYQVIIPSVEKIVKDKDGLIQKIIYNIMEFILTKITKEMLKKSGLNETITQDKIENIAKTNKKIEELKNKIDSIVKHVKTVVFVILNIFMALFILVSAIPFSIIVYFVVKRFMGMYP